MTAIHGYPEQISGIAEGWWICLPDCGNEPDRDGFYAADPQGRIVEPVAGAWDGITCVCDKCGRIFDENTGDVIGIRKPDLVTETSTCGNCAQRIEKRGGVWQHVIDIGVYLNCAATRSRAVPVDPDNASTLLGVILVNLRVIGASAITLYADGFEISGPDNVSLLFVGGAFSSAAVAASLHVSADAITDVRDQRALS